MVYVFCSNAQNESHSDPHDICTLSLLYQLPNCNLVTQHVLFILWRDTTSELWTPVQFPLHCYTILILLALFTFLHTIILLPLDTLNPLFTANRWDWQSHRKLGAKFLVVLCGGFTLLLGEDTPTIFLAPLSGVSRLREDLLLCSSYLLLGFLTVRSSISTSHHQTNNPPAGCHPSNRWVLSCKQQIIALSKVCSVNNTNVLKHKIVVFSLVAIGHLQP
jgi:hypothetical protein